MQFFSENTFSVYKNASNSVHHILKDVGFFPAVTYKK